MSLKSLYLLIFTLILSSYQKDDDFLISQKAYKRVKIAFEKNQKNVENSLKKFKLDLNNFNLLFVAYKDLDELEIYVKSKNETKYQHYKTFQICSRSGVLGPKNKQGDGQVPEGIYHIDRFNPTSNFLLSLGLNYPNQSDLIRSNTKYPGGDIFIHGSCVSIGCLPMTDEFIQEIYMMAVLAKNNGQKSIPVYIFPFKMNDDNMGIYLNKYGNNENLVSFWKNLKPAYNLFKKHQKEIKHKVLKDGKYLFFD